MFGSKFAMPAVVLAALVFAAVPLAVALNDANGDMDSKLVNVRGEVTAFLYDDEDQEEEDDDQNETDDDVDDDQDDVDDENEAEDVDDDQNETDDEDDEVKCASIMTADYAPGERVYAFVIDNETVVTFGPWWYWMYMDVSITDVVHVGDMLNVTGEWCNEDDATVLEAWHIENETTGDEFTIKEEGRPPWAGGPKALGIVPWPPDFEDE